MNVGCNLPNAQKFFIPLILQVCTEKRGGNYRSPNVYLETQAKFSHFLRSVMETIRTADSAEDEEEESGQRRVRA